MRSKFQLNEGEPQRILNLHKTAILKENGKNNIGEEVGSYRGVNVSTGENSNTDNNKQNKNKNRNYPITLKKREGINNGLKNNDVVTKIKEISSNKDLVELKVTFKSDGSEIKVNFQCETPDVMVIKDGDAQQDGSEYRVGENFKNLIKWYCAGKPKKGTSGQGANNQNLTYSLKYDRTFTSKKNKDKTVKLKAGTILTFKPEKGGATFKFGNKFGWFSCSTTNISFGSKTSRRIYSANNEEFTKTLKAVCKQMGVTIPGVDDGPNNSLGTDGTNNSLGTDGTNNSLGTDGTNTGSQDIPTDVETTLNKVETVVNTSGVTETLSRFMNTNCQNGTYASKKCNDESLKMQVLINDTCDQTVLNNLMRNYPNANIFLDGRLQLLEDGEFGKATKAAFVACQSDIIKKGTSGMSINSGSSGSSGVSGTSGSVGVQGAEDLKLTDAEYVKLTS